MKKSAFVAVFFVFLSQTAFTQGKIAENGTVPLKKVSLLTSGVGYFEHSGTVNGDATVDLPFHFSAMNDALKSLVARDPNGSGIQIRYLSENYAWTALEDLAVDLRGRPTVFEILQRQRGAEIIVTRNGFFPFPRLPGRARGAERENPPSTDQSAEQNTVQGEARAAERDRRFRQTARGLLLSADAENISLYAKDGVRIIKTRDVETLAFTDPRINEDFQKALSLVSEEGKNSTARKITVALGGSGAREVSLSYVIPAAVWKAGYRLDLSAQTPFLQAWAIVDNDSGSDWENVTLTLVSGRPVSFVQQLYAPYHLARPVKPLEIAGTAEALSYGGAMMDMAAADTAYEEAAGAVRMSRAMPKAAPSRDLFGEPGYRGLESFEAVGQTGANNAGFAVDSGFSFEWTFKNPVTIARGQSVMLPFAEGTVEARKALIFNGRTASAQATHPQIGVELVNTTGRQLPPGPVTVFDGGAYAGDALVSFLGAGDKRLLSYADDLSVSGAVSSETRRAVSSVKIAGGVMTVTRKTSYEQSYTFSNTSMEEKNIIIEHPIRFNAALAVPEKADERTDSVYRFRQIVPAQRSLVFKVVEEIPGSERLSLTSMSIDGFLSYASNREIPENVRSALRQAVTLWQEANTAAAKVNEIENDLQRALAEQTRIRDNLTAVGTETEAGAQYLARLREVDTRIDTINAGYDEALGASRSARQAYDDYIAGLEL